MPFTSFLFFYFFGTDGYILYVVQYILEPVLHPVVFNFPLLNPYIVLPPQPLPSSLFSISVRLLHFSSVAHSCATICDPVDCSTPGLPVHRQLPEFTQTHVHWVCDAIQPSHPLLSPSPAFNLSQHQGLFQWLSSSHKVAKVLEFQLQHQSLQWTLRTDLL